MTLRYVSQFEALPIMTSLRFLSESQSSRHVKILRSGVLYSLTFVRYFIKYLLETKMNDVYRFGLVVYVVFIVANV